jgi:predicted RND superfamily exporter protein
LAATRRVVPAGEFDEQVASDVADTLAVRLEESKILAFSRRAWTALEGLLPEKAVKDENARRKILGLLAEAADDLAVVPAAGLGAIAGNDPGLGSIEQSGMPAALARLDYFLFVSQVQSIGLVLIITFLLMSIMRKSFRLGIVSTIPIIITVAVMYGTMGLAKIPLDYATMMIAGVSFGVGIDYSIHFVYGVSQALKTTSSLEKAVEAAFREKGRAILANSIAVTMGFLVLLLSSMSPLRTFGGMMVLSMFLAALTSLTTLPALLLWIKPFKGVK